MKLWACRDENGDLYLFDGPPDKHKNEDGNVYWDSEKYDSMPLNIEELHEVPHGGCREMVLTYADFETVSKTEYFKE